MKTLFNECHQDIHTDGGPDLGFDGILGGTVEGFDTQVLFNPFEEQLDLPAIAVEFGDGVCGQGKVVGEEIERLVCLWVAVFDASQWLWVVGGGADTGQDNGLVTEQAGGFIDRSRVTAAVAGIGLGPDNEEGGGDSQGEQALEIEVGAVHDVAGTRLGDEQVEDVDIVQFAVGEMDKGGDIAAQVQQGMQFDGGVNRKLKCPLFRILKCPRVDKEMAVSIILCISPYLATVPVSLQAHVPTTLPCASPSAGNSPP